MANNEIQKNKDNILSMIAITEDITRTTSRLHDVLYNLMSNPGDIKNIKNSISDLYDKINTLKEVTIEAPLIEEEIVIVPGPNDVSPEEDPNYKSYIAEKAKTESPPPPKPKKNLSKRSPNKSARVQKPPREVQKRVSTRKPYSKGRPLPDTTD